MFSFIPEIFDNQVLRMQIYVEYSITYVFVLFISIQNIHFSPNQHISCSYSQLCNISLSVSGGTNCTTLIFSTLPSVITGSKALYPQYFGILGTNGAANQRALQIQLVSPNILKSTDSVTVTVTVAVDVSYASNNDYDLIIGISDGQSFIGFITHDRTKYPCYVMEADSNTHPSSKFTQTMHPSSKFTLQQNVVRTVITILQCIYTVLGITRY